MSDVTFTDTEAECAKRLGAMFDKGDTFWNGRDFAELGLTQDNYVQVLSMMEHYGLIDNASKGSLRRFSFFKVTPHAVQVARDIIEQEKTPPEAPDIVAQTTETFRRHPIAGRIIFWWIGAAAVVMTLAGGFTIVEKAIAIFRKPEPPVIHIHLPDKGIEPK